MKNRAWIMQFMARFGYPLIILGIVTILFFSNHQAGTWMTGWDNLHPEFDHWLNLQRTLTSAWQEHQGLGLPAAMAHGADLPRQLILLVLDIFLPTEVVRYTYMFIALFFGAFGMYLLMKWLIQLAVTRKKFVKLELTVDQVSFIAFLTALVYLFNLGTVQTYFVTIEMFPTQWAALPWLFWLFFKSIEKPTRKIYLYFAIATFFAAPMAYTPTVFFTYAGVITLVSLTLLARSIKLKTLKKVFIRIVSLGAITILVNAFWLVPFAYFYISGGTSTVLGAKINIMSSEDSFAINRKYANPENVALLKGFWFETTDYDAKAVVFKPTMSIWQDHLDLDLVRIVGYGLFGLSVIGVFYSLIKKLPYSYALAVIYIVAFVILLNGSEPFSSVFNSLTQISPALKEALRFPFTKFSQLATFAYALFVTFGIISIIDIGKRITKTSFTYMAGLVIIFMLILFASPMFSGGLISKNVQQSIPQEYFELFGWSKQQEDKTSRVVIFPQQTFWSWIYYDWGYRGSGFIWYGMKQPVMDRAFDVWSNFNEQYYKELDYAIYTKDLNLLKSVQKKYGVRWIILDKSILLNDEQEPLYYDYWVKTLEGSPEIERVANFGDDLIVFDYTEAATNKLGGFKVNQVVNNNGFQLAIDEVYSVYDNYTSSTTSQEGINILAADKKKIEQSTQVKDGQIITSIENKTAGRLVIPNINRISGLTIAPDIYLDEKLIFSGSEAGVKKFIEIGPGMIKLVYPLLDSNGVTSSRFDFSSLDATESCSGEQIDQAEKELNNGTITIAAKDIASCELFKLEKFRANNDLILVSDYENISGANPVVCINSYNNGRCDYNDKLSAIKFIPRFNSADSKEVTVGLNLTITQTSRGNFPSINRYNDIHLQYYPVEFISKLYILPNTNINVAGNTLNVDSVQEFIDQTIVTAKVSGNGYLTNNQAYNPGWLILSSLSKTEHLIANSWANLWSVETPTNSGEEVVLIYVPQLFTYIGLTLTLLALYYLAILNLLVKSSARQAGVSFN